MFMKKNFILILLCFGSLFINAQTSILLANRDIKPTKDIPVNLIYGLYEGDVVTITLSTNKDKTIDNFTVVQAGKNLFSANDLDPTQKIEVKIPAKGFVGFNFSGPKSGQDISVRIERKPKDENGKYQNTAAEQTKIYDTAFYEYEIDSVIGYDEIKTPIKFNVISDASYSSVNLYVKKFNIKGVSKKSVIVTRPQDLIQTINSEKKFLGYQITISSAAGASKMWDAIATGVDIGTMCLELALPAGGVVAGLGIQTAFEMIGPQEGGEPVYYAIMNNKQNLDYFMDDDSKTQPRAFEFGLATGYNCTWAPMDTVAIGLENLNIYAEVDVTVSIDAIYQETTRTDVYADKVTIKPKTVKVKRGFNYIQNKKDWKFQD